jgi:signal peptidase I
MDINQPTVIKKENSWDDTIRTIIIAGLLAVAFRSLAYEPFHIPSGSMKSNLLVGDYLFVSKYSYGYSRYSFPFGFPLFEGRVIESKPKRGDVAVFRLPNNPRIDYIKRVIGLPGDRVQVIGGIVHINGQALKRSKLDPYSDTEMAPASCISPAPDADEIARYMLFSDAQLEKDGSDKPVFRSIPRYAETLPEGKVIPILKECIQSNADNTVEYKVPQGHYFMMGDNRDNSRDSRFLHEVGYVPEENLVGRAEFIFFSTDGSARWLNPISWFTAARFERFFRHIE